MEKKNTNKLRQVKTEEEYTITHKQRKNEMHYKNKVRKK